MKRYIIRFMAHARRPAAAVATLLFLTLAGYANSFPGSFIWDDSSMIVDNPLVSSPNLLEIFTTDYCGRAANCGTYRPLTILSYALNRQLFGAGPAVFHAVNVILHAMVTLLLYLLLVSLGLGQVLAWTAAALFGVHPIHTEVVNIATFRSESLAALFVLLALLTAVRRTPGHGILTLVAFACALLSKESGLVFLLLLPLVDAFSSADPTGTYKERRVLYAGSLALTTVWFILRHLVAQAATVPPDLIYPADNPLVSLPFLPRILTAMKAQLIYLCQLLLPIRLQSVYTGSSIGVVTTLFSPWGLISTASAALGLAAAIWGWSRRSPFGLGLIFYAASFVVTANFIFTMPVLLGERLAYLPSAGFCLAVASLLTVAKPAQAARRRLSLLSCAGCCGYLLLLGWLLVLRNRDFSGEMMLAQTAVRRDPGNARAWFYLGGAYEEQGNSHLAEKAFRNGIAADPGFPENYGMLAWLLARSNRHEEARDMAMQALRVLPGVYPLAMMALASANLGLGNHVEARVWLERAAPVFLGKVTFWDLRARILTAQGDLHGALESHRQGFALNEDPEAGLALSELLLSSGRQAEAERILYRVDSRLLARLRQYQSPWLLNLYGYSQVLQENYALAAQAFRKAVELDPQSPLYRSNYEKALVDSVRRRAQPAD